jgi:hypothetical protein
VVKTYNSRQDWGTYAIYAYKGKEYNIKGWCDIKKKLVVVANLILLG